MFLAKGVRRYLGPKEELGRLRPENEEGGPAGVPTKSKARTRSQAEQLWDSNYVRQGRAVRVLSPGGRKGLGWW